MSKKTTTKIAKENLETKGNNLPKYTPPPPPPPRQKVPKGK